MEQNDQSANRAQNTNSLLGIALVIIGSLFLLDQFHMFRLGSLVATWWPMVFIIIGSLFLTQKPKNIRAGGLFLVIGILLQLGQLNIFSFSVWNLWPVILIALGIHIIANQRATERNISSSDDETINHSLFFADSEIQNTSKTFAGGHITVIFGTAEIDLSKVKLKEDATLSVTVLFGDITLRLPQKLAFASRVTTIIADVADHHSPEDDDATTGPTLSLRGTAIVSDLDVVSG